MFHTDDVTQSGDYEGSKMPVECYLPESVAVVMFSLVVIQLVLTKLLTIFISRTWTSFVLNAEAKRRGETKSKFQLQVAINILAFCFNAVMGPAAMFCALSMVIYGDPVQLVNVSTMHTNAWICHKFRSGMWLGVIFTSYVLNQLCCLIIGWEEGIEKTLHHVIFCCLGILSIYYAILPELSCFAIAMEVSTPSLIITHVFRQLEGYDSVVRMYCNVLSR